MSQLAVNLTHAIAISPDDSLIIWGEDQDQHFTGLPYNKNKDGSRCANIKLKWRNVLYKPTMVSTRGPMTAVVGVAPKIAGSGKTDDVRKILLAIEEEYIKRKSPNYSKLLNELLVEADKAALAKRKNEEISKEKSVIMGVSMTAGQGKEQKTEMEKNENPNGPPQADVSEMMQEIEVIAKKAVELSDMYDYEEKDDEFYEQMHLEKILISYFKFKPREVDMFIYEMIKLSAHKVHSKISIRTIKDCIKDARLDDGRLFLFISKKSDTVKLKVKQIDESYNMSLLYCPDSYISIEAVACGGNHLLILTHDGQVYACGDSSQGALGIGHTKGYMDVPMLVTIKKHKGLRKVKQIAAGLEHSMCLTVQHEVFTWGNGIKGKLGHGDEVEQRIPKELTVIRQFTPISLTAGDTHSACVTAAGKLYTWGDGQYGKLGHGSNQSELTPMRVAALSDVEIISVSCGPFHTLAVDKSGKVWSFGQSKNGKLGHLDIDHSDIPLTVKNLDGVRTAFASTWNSYVVDRNNRAFSWGSSEKDMLGHKEDPAGQHVPKPIEWLKIARVIESKGETAKEASSSSKVAQVVCSFTNTFAITDAGEVYVFGSNENGQCGADPKKVGQSFKKPFKMPLFTPENNCQVKVLACGFSHCLAVTTQRKLYAWGHNDCGQLGNGRKDPVFEPTLVDVFRGTVIEFCACGDEYSAVINETGELYTFGSHSKGRLGIGPVDENGCELIPQKVQLAGFPHIKYICCGVNHVLAIPDYDSEEDNADKGIWSWGLSTRGQLGHGNRITQYSPQLITKLAKEKFKKVACGYEHSMALTESGKMYYWGAQDFYLRAEFGHNEDKLEPAPMQASSTDKVIDIAANHMYNMAIAATKDVIFWGNFLLLSREKKLHIGIVIESKLGIKAEQISCGPNHASAIGIGDTLFTWGYDSDGSLGLNLKKKDYQPTPEKVWSVKEAIDKSSKRSPLSASVPDKPAGEDKGGDDKGEEEIKEEEKEGEEEMPIEETKKEEPTAKPGKDADKKQLAGAKPAAKKKESQSRMAKINELPENATVQMIHKASKLATELKQEILGKSQRKLARQLDSLLNMFKDVAKAAHDYKLRLKSLVISLISRLENGPFPQKRKLHLITKEVKAVKQNKAYLKDIFKALYLHPCYLMNLLNAGLINTTFAGSVINSLYMNNADGKFSKELLKNLGMMVFKYEVFFLIRNI